MEEIFIQLAMILVMAFVVSYIVRSFKQPLVVGYVIAGILISPIIIKFGTPHETIDVLSKFGIAFLLFMVGLHLNPRVIKEVGKPSVIIGIGQIIISFIVGYLIASQLLNYGLTASIYIGIALGFSSTIIIMKLLSDKRDLDSLHGKLSIGILIVQDLVATFVLIFISSTTGAAAGSFGFENILIGIGVIALLIFAGYFIMPPLTKKIAKNQELLFLFAISWCFLIAALFHYLGLSIEIGALLAGIVLSISPYSMEISAKIRPLRDFFLIIFFIILGFNIPTENIGNIIGDAIIFSLVVLIGNPLIVMFLMKQFRYKKRTNFLVGTTIAQISEFSLIVLLLGASVGQINSELVHTLTLTMIITMLFSAYLIIYSKHIYNKLHKFLEIFERNDAKEKGGEKEVYDAILFGYNRIGFNILDSLKASNKRYLVVDFNPDTINRLRERETPCLYGDVDDSEFLNELPLEKAQIAVSTIPDHEANTLLLEFVRAVNPEAIVILRAHRIRDALELYKKGANYVLTPHFLGGEYVSKMIREKRTSARGYKKEREKHMKMLYDMEKERKKKRKISPHSTQENIREE